MTGFGGMVSFELNGTVEEVVSFVSSRRFFALGESLGGVKALVCHPGPDDARVDSRPRSARSSGCPTRSSACRRAASTSAISSPISSKDLAAIEQARALAVAATDTVTV